MSVVYSKSTIHGYFDTDGDKATFSRDDAEKFLNDAGFDNDETDAVLDEMFATEGQTYERVWEFVTDLKEKFLPENSQQKNGSEAYHTTLRIDDLESIFDAEANDVVRGSTKVENDNTPTYHTPTYHTPTYHTPTYHTPPYYNYISSYDPAPFVGTPVYDPYWQYR